MKFIFAALVLVSLPTWASPASSPNVDLHISSNGLILETAAQSCVDASMPTSPPSRSLYPGVARWSSATLTWDSTDLDLFIGQLKITLTSPQLPGGKFVTTLDSTEIEFMFGLVNATVPHATQAGSPTILVSSSPTKGVTSSGVRAVPCAFSVGGVPTGNVQGPFTANVEISMVGTAFDPLDKKTEQVIEKTITTTATYY